MLDTSHLDYYHDCRTHLSLDRNSPDPRPVTKVADAAGFNSLSYLSKVFHREVGQTLAHYRRQHRVL